MPNPLIINYTKPGGATWWPIKFPMDCNGYLIKNLGPDTCFHRTDQNDASTEDSFTPGGGEGLSLPVDPSLWRNQRGVRYQAGDVLYYVNCAGPIMLKVWL